MQKFPYRLRYVWDGQRAGYYARVYRVADGAVMYQTRTYRTRKEARDDVEARIKARTLIGVN